jgi:hypothetical protein
MITLLGWLWTLLTEIWPSAFYLSHQNFLSYPEIIYYHVLIDLNSSIYKHNCVALNRRLTLGICERLDSQNFPEIFTIILPVILRHTILSIPFSTSALFAPFPGLHTQLSE